MHTTTTSSYWLLIVNLHVESPVRSTLVLIVVMVIGDAETSDPSGLTHSQHHSANHSRYGIHTLYSRVDPWDSFFTNSSMLELERPCDWSQTTKTTKNVIRRVVRGCREIYAFWHMFYDRRREVLQKLRRPIAGAPMTLPAPKIVSWRLSIITYVLCRTPSSSYSRCPDSVIVLKKVGTRKNTHDSRRSRLNFTVVHIFKLVEKAHIKWTSQRMIHSTRVL